MSQTQSIYTRLFAQKAKQQFNRENARASRKMAFALADDLANAESTVADNVSKVDEYTQILEEAVGTIAGLQQELQNVIGQYGLTEQVMEAEQMLQEFNDQAFELGIDPEQSAAYMNLKQTLVRAREAAEQFESSLRTARQYFNI